MTLGFVLQKLIEVAQNCQDGLNTPVFVQDASISAIGPHLKAIEYDDIEIVFDGNETPSGKIGAILLKVNQ